MTVIVNKRGFISFFNVAIVATQEVCSKREGILSIPSLLSK